MSSEHSAFTRGSISGIVVVAILQPFDVVKTVQQASNCSPVPAIRKIIQQDGVKGLWLRGLAPTLARGAIGPGIYFQTLEYTQKWVDRKRHKYADFVQGALARAIGAIVISPFSVLKARIEWNPNSGMKFAGFRDMFVGLSHTMARDVPFSGLYVVFYRMLKAQTPMSEEDDDTTTASSIRRFTADLGAGLVAGVVATALTHPFDVFKTRSQIGMPVYHGLASFNGIWTGLSMRLAKRPLSIALTWAFFESVSRKDKSKENKMEA